MYLQRTALASAVLAVSTGVFANDLTTNSDNKKVPTSMLDQVTVSATRTERSIEQVAGSVSVITEQQLEDQLSTNIRDAMRYEPGVEVSGIGRSGISGVNIRGMDGNRVKIMVDGVDQSQQFDTSSNGFLRSQRNFIDIDALKAIEVVKGPASSLYGSDAMGGIVAFTTKDPSDYLAPTGDDSYGAIKGQYSSANEGFSETLTLANRTDKLDTLLVYTRRDYKETETHSGSTNITGPTRTAADPLDAGSDNILAKAQYQLNDSHRVGIITEYLNTKTDTKLKSGGGGSESLPSNSTGDDQMTRKRVGVFHEWDANLALFDKSKWTLDWQDSETEQKTWVPAYSNKNERIKDYSYYEKGYTLNGQFDKALTIAGLQHSIVYGLNASSTEGEVTPKTTYLSSSGKPDVEAEYMPKVDTLKYGLFIQDEITINDRLTVTPGLRYDHYKYKPSTTQYYSDEVKDTSDGKVTGRLGAVYKLTEELSVFGQYSQGFKAPGYQEMYFDMDHQLPGFRYRVLANPDLKPEEGDSWELGLRGKNHLGSFEIAGFYNKYKNFIDDEVPVSKDVCGPGYDLCYQAQNLSDAYIKGIELKGQLWLDEVIDAPMGTSLRGSIAYAKGEGKQKGESTKPLNSVAPLKAVLGLGYDDISGNWGGELAWTLVKGKSSSDVDEQISTRSSETQYIPAGYGIVDLTAYYKPTNDITLRGGVFNITDKKYTVWDDVRGLSSTKQGLDRYTQPGRNFGVSATWEF